MWLENLAETVDKLPEDAGEFTEEMISECEKLDPKKYDM